MAYHADRSANGIEEYYKNFIELQQRLRKSEEERLQLEMKFNEMIQTTQEEEQLYYKRLKTQYKHFVEENRKRQERNENILMMLERIKNRADLLEAKSKRLKLLRYQYHSYMDRVEREQNMLNKQATLLEDKPITEGIPTSILRQFDDMQVNENRHNITDLGDANRLSRFKEPSEISIGADRIKGSLRTRGGSNLYSKENARKIKYEDESTAESDSTLESALKDKRNSRNSPYLEKIFNGDKDERTISSMVSDDVRNQGDLSGSPSKTNIIDEDDIIETDNLHLEKNTEPVKEIDVIAKEIHDIQERKEDLMDGLSEFKETSNLTVVNDEEKLHNDNLEKQQEIENFKNENPIDTIKEEIGNQDNIHRSMKSSTEAINLKDEPQMINAKNYEEINEDNINLGKDDDLNPENTGQQYQNVSENSEFLVEQSEQNDGSSKELQNEDKSADLNQSNPEFQESEVNYTNNEKLSEAIQQISPEQQPQDVYNENDQNLWENSIQEEVAQNDEVLPVSNQENPSEEQQEQQNQQMYDENGQPIWDENQKYSESQGDANQYEENNQQMYYDENGQPVQYDYSQNGYDENGQPIAYDQNYENYPQYDENGQIINYEQQQENVYYDENGQPVMYDENSSNQYQENQENQQMDVTANQQNVEATNIEGEGERQANVMDLLDTESENTGYQPDDTSKTVNESDFEFSSQSTSEVKEQKQP